LVKIKKLIIKIKNISMSFRPKASSSDKENTKNKGEKIANEKI
jgi:hypothetical protein